MYQYFSFQIFLWLSKISPTLASLQVVKWVTCFLPGLPIPGPEHWRMLLGCWSCSYQVKGILSLRSLQFASPGLKTPAPTNKRGGEILWNSVKIPTDQGDILLYFQWWQENFENENKFCVDKMIKIVSKGTAPTFFFSLWTKWLLQFLRKSKSEKILILKILINK